MPPAPFLTRGCRPAHTPAVRTPEREADSPTTGRAHHPPPAGTQAAEPDAAEPRAVTGRALVIGAVGSAILGFGCPYATHVLRGSFMDIDFSTAGAVFLLFALVVGPNVALRTLRRRWALTGSELVTAYCMMVIASAVTTMGLSSQLPPLITAPYYYATPENKWAEVLLPHLKPWLSPAGAAPEAPVIVSFYEGAPSGQGVPWQAWLPTLGAWLPFLLCLHFVMICLMVLLRRQWVERERLVYPLTQLPLELAATGRTGPRLLRQWPLWLGFAAPFIVGSLIGLHNYFGVVPAPRLYWTIPVFRRSLSLILRLSAPMLGFFYLVTLDTSFSLWFFNRLMFIARGIMNVYGVGLRDNLGVYGSPSPTFAHLGMGAIGAMVLSNLWVARSHLRSVVSLALGGRDGRASLASTGEIVPLPAALWGLVAGMVVLCLWLNATGIPWLVLPVFLGAAMVLFIGLTRIVVESGMAEAVASTIAPGFTVAAVGAPTVGKSGVAAMGIAYVWCSDIRTYVMASAANSLKMADALEDHRPRLFWGMLLALVVAIATSLWFTLHTAYREGSSGMEPWYLRGGPIACYSWVVEKLSNPTGPSWWGLVIGAGGAALYVGLTAMRYRVVRWPFHPIGITIGGVWIMDQIWFTCFLAWLAKWAILRYGGLKAFHGFRPFFLGLILGQFACNGVWLILDAITGHTDNAIFWI